MSFFLGQFVTGLALGSAYALLALAIVMARRGSGTINLAQGEMATLSAFLLWQMLDWGFGYPLSLAGSLALSFLGGGALGWAFFRVLHRAPELGRIAATIALFAIVNGITGFVWGHTPKDLPSPFAGLPALGGIGPHLLGTIAATLAMLALLALFFRRTRAGLMMRGAAEQPKVAELLGVSIGAMVALGWGMAAVVGAVAGILVAPALFLEPNMMGLVILYGLAAAVVGGLTSPAGAVAAGFGLGLFETLAGAYLPVLGRELKLALLFALIMAALLLRRGGVLALRAEGRP